MKESNLQSLIRLSIAKLSTMFRINAGMAWTGSSCKKQMNKSLPYYGCMIIHNPRPFHGAPTGYSDLSGFTPVVVTQEMVGKTVAVFTAIEVKTPTGRATKKQINFMDHVINNGGKAGVARSVEDALEIINSND